MASETDWLTKYPEAKQESWLDKYPEATEKPFFDLSDTLSATGRAFTSLGTSVPASMRQAFGGLENPWQRSEGYAQSRADMQALQQELEASDAAAMAGGDASSVSSSIREATPSLGFSGSTLVPSLAAGAVTALATKSPLAARSAAAGTSLLMAYRMAGAQFLDDSRERIDNFFQEKLQRPLTPEEQNEAYEELLPLARKFGAAEAGPEALGNMALGGAGKYIRKALGGKNGIMSLASNALSKVTGAKAVGAGVGAAAGEVGTEAITAVEQDRINKEFEQSVLRGEAPESVVLPDRTVQDYTQGITNVAPTTLAMTGLTGLAGLGPTAINRGYRALRPQAEQQVVETEIVPEEPAISPGLTAAVNTADSIVTTAENTSSDVSQATTAARNIIQGVVNTPQPQVAPAIELPAVTPSPAMEMPEKTSQTITDSNGEIAPEMSVLPPTVQAGAGAGEAIQPQPIETAPDAIIQREIPENRVEERLQIDEGGPSAAPSSGNRFIEGGQIQEEVAPPITPQGTPTPATETLGVTAPPAPEVDTSETPPRAVNAPLDPADKQIDAPIAAKNGYVVFERPDGKRYKLRDNSKTPPEWQNAEGKKVMLKGFGTRIGNSFLLQPQSKNSDYNEKAPVGDTVYHLYEEDSGRGLGNMSATELFQTGWTFVEEVKPAEAPPITPKGEAPTPATEGTVMPGGSAIERDVEFSVDEQLLMHSPFTNEDSSVSFRGVMPDGDAVVWSGKTQMKVPSAWLRRAGEPLPISANKVGDVPISVIDQESQPDSSVTVTTDRQQTLPIPKTKDGLIAEMVGPIKTDYVARQAQQKLINNYKKFSKDELLDMVKDQRARDAEFKRRQEATLAIIEQIKEPVNNAGTGWVRSIKDIAKSNGIDDYSILQGNSRGEEIYRIAARIADRGNAFVNPFQESPQTTTVAAPTETAAPSAKEAAVASVVQQPVEGSIPTVEQESAITAIESTEKTDIANAAMSFLEEDLTAQQRKVWTPEMFTAAQAFFDSGGKDFDSLKKAIKFPRVVQQAYLKADKEAAAEQTRREAADAAMAREVEKATKEQAKLEADQKQREELGLKTLNSLIEKTRTNVVQGTVKSSDANQAVAILNKSGAIPNVLFTWIGTSKDFLADPANRARYPETWKAVSSNPNIEGMSENGQPIVFTDNVGVSDLDRNLAKLQGTTPEVAAVRRVILHENIHKGMFFLSLKDKMKLFQFLHRLYSPEELDQLAKSYDEYSDWRINQVSYFSIIEEAMTRDFDSMAEIPRDGIWAEFMQFLRDIWQKITGKTSEPTLKNYKDVFRLIRNSLKNSEAANADRLKNGGGVRMSMSEFISNVTPEQDAAYAKAVADGDMETAQRMVDEAAKAARYTERYDHGTPNKEFTTFNLPDASKTGVARMGPGIYGAAPSDTQTTNTYARNGRVIPMYVNMDKVVLGDSLDEKQVADMLSVLDADKTLRDGNKVGRFIDQYRNSDSLNEMWGLFQITQPEKWYEAVSKAGIEGATRFSAGVENGEIVLFKQSKVKSADPVTYDESGNVIPLSRRFQSASNDIRFSKVTYDSPNEAAFNSGAEVARNADYDERDKAVRSTIRAAYDLAPKPNGPSVPLDQLFDIAKQSMPDLTENEFSQILQDLYEDSGALLQAGESPFSIFNNEGERAGSAIIMPPTDMTKDDVISMLRGMSAANPAPSGGINQELYDTVLTRLRDFISNGGRVPLPIQLDRSGEANMDNYTGKKAGLGGGLRQGSGVGRAGQTDSGTPLFDGLPEGVQGVIPQAQRVESEVSRNREAIAGRGENREGKAGARPDMGMASGGYTFADYAQIASRIGARVQEVSNDIGGGLAVMADENGATTILINAAQLSERMAGISFGLDEDGAIETIGNALVEELIHAADLAVQREAWIASGRRKPFTEFATNSDKSMLDEMREVVASSNDPVKATQILHDAIQASRQLYGAGATPSDIDELFSSPKGNISSVMSEFVRQMIQQDMHQTVSEASLFRRFIERVMKMLQKIRDAIAPAKAGEFGDILKNRINETEMMLAMAYQQTGARASMIDSDSPATNEYKQNIDAANTGKAKAPFGGVQFTNFMPIDRAVKSAEEYSEAAIKYVNNLENEGVSLDNIANSVISPAFLESIGIEQDLMAQDALTIEVRQRVDNAARKAKSPDRKKQLSKLSERLSAFWQGVGSKKGQHLGQRRYLVNKARYSWMFIRELAEKAMKEARTNILISNFGSENATSFTQNSYENADMASTVSADEVAKDTINDTEWDLIKEGEQVFDGARKTIWERVKFLVARIALYARAEAAEIKSASKASFTDAQRDELASILTMPKAEREKAKAKDLAELDSLMAKLLGEESPTDTPTEKKKRNKRKEIIDTVEKRVKAGEPIEAPDYVPIITENPQRDEIIDDVANSLLQVAKNRGIKPSQKTALADLVASIKSLLKKNIKGEDLKADEVPLGQLLARTYLDNLTATEAKLFAQSWNRGRDKVRKMLAETGLEGAALEAELSAIMPATPTIAYNPSAVRKAITRALREATLDANDLLANPKETKAEILKVWDKAAVDAGLSPENWQEGRKLAEKSINEFIIERKAAKERSKQIAIAVVEQSKNPASLADFSNSLAQFKIKPDKVRELFDQAKLLAKRRVQIANDKAIRVLFEAENKLAQSAFFNSATKPDTIVKAFRDQISDPMDRKAFKDRLMAMEVTSEMADRLFDKAARTKDNAQWKRAQDMLEGPNALRNILREINRARPGDQAPLSKQIPWRELLSQNAKTVEEYRQRIFDAISANEELKSATPEQKARLADLFAEAWEANRTRILDGMLERMIRSEEAKKNLSKEGAKALQEQRMRIVEDINLGIFDNDELAKRMAEKFGVKSEFTEMEREKINSLIEVLQDEGLNAVKRQVAAYKLLEVLQGELKIPVAKMLADFWVSSVLSGPNTIVSIGLAVASGAFELSTALSRVFIAGFTNQKQLPSELAGAYKTLARLLSAFGRQANIAWQYLVTGDPAFLDPSMNDVTENMQWGNIGKSNKLAEQMAKSDKILVKSAGLFMRTVSRLLTALDVFNSGLTKEGSLSIVFRQIGLDPEKIAALEKKSDLKPYKDAIIQKDFGGTPPKSARDKAIVDSYALSDMMAELDKLGNVSENANFFGQQGAMTLDPSGLGGVGYRAIRSLVTNFESGSDRFLKKAQRGWSDSAQNGDQILSGLELALAYALQFLAYNAANFGGVRFARFAGNKFNQGLSFIPGIGFARAFEAEFDPDRIKAKEAFIDSIQRNQLVGVILSIGGYYILKAIADEPDDEKRGWFINGGWGNLTPEKKQQKLAAGEKEYTIGINGKVFNYANWPISSALAAIGSLSDLIRFSPDQWKDKNVTQIMASAAMSGAAAAADIPALSQFQELFGNSLSSKDPNEKRMERFAKVMSSYAGGFVPRFLKDIDYSQDPNLRKYETLWEKTASHIPIYRRYEGKEYYDILGQQIQRNVYPGSREFMTKPTDPAYKVLGALISRGIWLTPANAEHRMVGKGARRRSLTQEEADNYSLETGKGYKQMLLRYGQRALQMPTERAKAFLLDKADDVRDRALKKVYRGYTPAS